MNNLKEDRDIYKYMFISELSILQKNENNFNV